MNNKQKEILVKSSIVVSLSLLVLFIIFPIICVALGYNFEQSENAWIVVGVITLISGVVMMILMWFIKITPDTAKPYKVKLTFNNYDELKEILNSRLVKKEYSQTKELSFFEGSEIILYIKLEKMNTANCFAIIRTSELSDEIINSANDKVTTIMQDYYGKKIITDTINMISLFCVDRITPSFRKLVSMNIQQGIKNGRFVAGVSFGGKNIYIANQLDGYAIKKYKQMREEFIDVMGIN